MKLGLALGGGCVKGVAHIGVLKVLEREHIPIHAIAGTSIGAFIGALYASGLTAEEIEQIILSTHIQELIDFTIPKKGFITGNKIEKYLTTVTKGKNFADLQIPLAIIATELQTGKKVVFTKGNVAHAIRASMSIPGVFTPVKHNDMLLVDGAFVDPVPVEVVRELGATVVIAVDVSQPAAEINLPSKKTNEENSLILSLKKNFVDTERGYLKEFFKAKKYPFPGIMYRIIDFIFDRLLTTPKIVKVLCNQQTPEIVMVMTNSMDILANQLAQEKLKTSKVEVLIHPKLEGVAWIEFDRSTYIIKQGERAAEEQLPKIIALLKNKKAKRF
ncbi:patatin-like phospholipase family protein [Candidatus Woesearchaeota archaeon]|nr:patatin-like phospholipase family protein [Candidatus Woesearchaeota archaeon]